MTNVYISIFDDCATSDIVHKRLINVVRKFNEEFKFNKEHHICITILNLYNIDDAQKADELGVFDAPCITCNEKHLLGLVEEEAIVKFLKECINYD